VGVRVAVAGSHAGTRRFELICGPDLPVIILTMERGPGSPGGKIANPSGRGGHGEVHPQLAARPAGRFTRPARPDTHGREAGPGLFSWRCPHEESARLAADLPRGPAESRPQRQLRTQEPRPSGKNSIRTPHNVRWVVRGQAARASPGPPASGLAGRHRVGAPVPCPRATAAILGAPATHCCQRVRPASGCRLVLSRHLSPARALAQADPMSAWLASEV